MIKKEHIRIVVLILSLGLVAVSLYISHLYKSIDITANGSNGPITVFSDQNIIFSFHGRGDRCEVSQSGEGNNVDITASGIYRPQNNSEIINGQFTMGPGGELPDFPIGENINFPIKCFDKNGQQIGSDNVVVSIFDRYASPELKIYGNSIFSFKYPSDFSVNVDSSGSINVSSPACLSALEFGELMMSPVANNTTFWLEELKRENPTGYEFEYCLTNQYNIVTRCGFKNSLGSSVRQNAVLVSKDYRQDISYIESSLNYDQVAGQKVDPNKGVVIKNVCETAFDSIIKSFTFK